MRKILFTIVLSSINLSANIFGSNYQDYELDSPLALIVIVDNYEMECEGSTGCAFSREYCFPAKGHLWNDYDKKHSPRCRCGEKINVTVYNYE